MVEPNKPNQAGGSERGSAELSPKEARQSEKGRGLIYVLAGGLVLALAVWAVLELFAPKGASPDVETLTEDAEQVAPAAQ